MLKICLLLASVVAVAIGHGMMTDPMNRSSLWRTNSSFPINYADNQLWCGGRGTQHNINGGKCGVCGDDYRDTHPQPNEHTGVYGTGYITKQYKHADVISVTSVITANHLGFIQYHVCRIDDSSKPETGEDCFRPIPFEDGSATFTILSAHRTVTSQLRLPKEFTCDHCTLRWTYTAGNNWGSCGNGTGALGCGPQETFRSCADVAIV